MPKYAFVVCRSEDVPYVLRGAVCSDSWGIFNVPKWSVILTFAGHANLVVNNSVELRNMAKPHLKAIYGIGATEQLSFCKIVCEPPGDLISPKKYGPAPNFWSNETASIVAETYGLRTVIETSPYIKLMDLKHHDLKDLVQNLSLGIAEMMTTDWIDQQDYLAEQYLLRKLLSGD